IIGPHFDDLSILSNRAFFLLGVYEESPESRISGNEVSVNFQSLAKLGLSAFHIVLVPVNLGLQIMQRGIVLVGVQCLINSTVSFIKLILSCVDGDEPVKSAKVCRVKLKRVLEETDCVIKLVFHHCN